MLIAGGHDGRSWPPTHEVQAVGRWRRRLIAEIQGPSCGRVAELLLQESSVRDQGVGIHPDDRIEDLVHRRAEQIQLVDQQHQ